MTWLQLYDRLRRQPLRQVKNSQVRIKNEDGSFNNLRMVFNKEGTLFWLEKEKL